MFVHSLLLMFIQGKFHYFKKITIHNWETYEWVTQTHHKLCPVYKKKELHVCTSILSPATKFLTTFLSKFRIFPVSGTHTTNKSHPLWMDKWNYDLKCLIKFSHNSIFIAFHLYHHFIQEFSSDITLTTKCLKVNVFNYMKKALKELWNHQELNEKGQRLIFLHFQTLVMSKVDCATSNVRIMWLLTKKASSLPSLAKKWISHKIYSNGSPNRPVLGMLICFSSQPMRFEHLIRNASKTRVRKKEREEEKERRGKGRRWKCRWWPTETFEALRCSARVIGEGDREREGEGGGGGREATEGRQVAVKWQKAFPWRSFLWNRGEWVTYPCISCYFLKYN